MSPLINSITILVLTIIFTAISTWLWKRHDRSTKREDDMDTESAKIREATNNKIIALEQQVAILNARLVPLWPLVQVRISTDLERASHTEADELLIQLNNKTIDEKGRARLITLMERRSIDPSVSEAEQLKATIMPSIMRLVEIEEELGPEIPPDEANVLLLSVRSQE